MSNVRYANDPLLSELALQLNKEVGSMNEYLRNGNLNAAFLRAHTLSSRIVSLMERLNDIRYGRNVPIGTP